MSERRGGWKGWTLVVVASLTGLGMGGGPLSAQEEARREAPTGERECRCVDAEGREIENCHCFRLPDVRSMSWTVERAPRARIGVMVGSTAEGDGDARGVLLQDVTPDSPADRAGLRAGDVVVAVDGRSVLEPLADEERPGDGDSATVRRFVELVGGLEPGEEAEFEYLRDGRGHTATVVPEERGLVSFFRGGPDGVRLPVAPDLPHAPHAPDAPDVRVYLDRLEKGPLVRSRDGSTFLFRTPEGEVRGEGWRGFGEDGEGLRLLSRSFDPCFTSMGEGRAVFLSTDRCVDGVHLQELNPGLAEYFEADEGVLVTDALEESTLGLRAGDVIVAIGDRQVESAADVRRVLRSYETDEPVVLTVVRRGEEIQVRGTRR